MQLFARADLLMKSMMHFFANVSVTEFRCSRHVDKHFVFRPKSLELNHPVEVLTVDLLTLRLSKLPFPLATLDHLLRLKPEQTGCLKLSDKLPRLSKLYQYWPCELCQFTIMKQDSLRAISIYHQKPSSHLS